VATRLLLLDGAVVAGMSTKRMMGYKKLAINQGETKRLQFTIPNNLGKKDVSVGVIITSGDKTTTFDNWDSAARIKNPNVESYYPIVYDHEVKIVG
jgi:hypothetical protein